MYPAGNAGDPGAGRFGDRSDDPADRRRVADRPSPDEGRVDQGRFDERGRGTDGVAGEGSSTRSATRLA